MATLQKIRNNAGLLVSVVIGMALLAFILGDLLKAGGSMFGASTTDVAEIAGKSVPVQLYQQKVDENVENYKQRSGQNSIDATTMSSVQDQTWEQILREYIMEDEFMELGITVSSDELFDMVQGNNIHPQVLQVPIFQNEATGQFDRTRVIQFLKNMELDPTGDAQRTWTAFERSLSQEQINIKYNSLIQKGLFITKAEAENQAILKNTKITFDYILLPFTTVADSSVTYTEKEVAAYYNSNLDKYDQAEETELNYVTFPVVASAEDDAQTKEIVTELIEEFKSVDHVEQFINLNSDDKFNGKYLSQEELPVSIADLYQAEEGTVFGPYKENQAYKIARVVKFENVADSVHARHILIQPNQIGADAAVALADSLYDVINKGGDFADIAIAFSSDGSAAEGGDLGWFTEGAMVKPFNDACFFGKVGELVKVESQFGTHLIEVLKKAKASKKVQVAVLSRNIEASSKTYQNTYAMASKFGGSNRTYDAFIEAAAKEALNPRYAKVGKNDRVIANLENPRQLVRWAFDGSEGDVSEIFEFGDVYVVAAIKKQFEEGTAKLEDVRVDVEREVKKQKKAEQLIAQLSSATEGASALQTIASAAGTSVKSTSNADFSAYSIPGLGFEPSLQGTIAALASDEISAPIEGSRGVYVVQIKNVTEPSIDNQVARERNQLSTSLASRVRYEVYNAIKEASDINDNRSTFY